MIRAERFGKALDVQIREDGDLIQEYALITMALLDKIPLKELLKVVNKAAEHKDDVKQLNDRQKSMFYLRLMHILELNSLTIDELCRQESLSNKDQEDLKEGTIPSIDGIKQIAKRFGLNFEYFFGADKE